MARNDTTTFATIVAVGLAAVGPGLLVWLAPAALRQYHSRDWPHTDGQVLQVRARDWAEDRARQQYYGEVTFRYTAGGQERTSQSVDLGASIKRANREAALDDVAKYHVGQRVPVYYDPRNPDVAILEPGLATTLLAAVGAATLLSVVLGIFAGVILWNCATARRQYSDTIEPADPAAAERAVQFDYNRPEWLSEIGNLQFVFGPSVTNLLAGWIIALGLMFGLPWAVYAIGTLPPRKIPTPADTIAGYSMAIVFGLGGPIGGIAVLRWCLRARTRRVLLGDAGLADVLCGQAAVCPWSQAQHFYEHLATETLPILKIPGAGLRVTAHTIQLERTDGKTFHFTRNAFRSFEQLASRLREFATAREIPWITRDER